MISIEKSMRTPRLDQGQADKIWSDRYMNSNNAACISWSGMDSTGRFVCRDSYVTQTAGCNSAVDRVDVENYQRPRYFDYVNLNGYGVQGDMYKNDTACMTDTTNNINNITGSFGTQFSSEIQPSFSGKYQDPTNARQY